MATLVYNNLKIRGKKDEVKKALEKCYGLSPMEECKSKKNKLYPTFNSYIKLDNDDRNKAYNLWGSSVDTLSDYSFEFDKAFKKISECEDGCICEVSVAFQTHNGIVFPWVQEMSKCNPNINIKYYVIDEITKYFVGFIFDKSISEEGYIAKQYSSNPELMYNFLDINLKDVFNNRVAYIQSKMEGYSGYDYVFKLEDVMDILETEFKFIPDEDFRKLVSNY
ncbi:MAG: hypothetical protein IJH34_09945 [Romboutsia sp.]|nr:hypothetical protein [Romboutsia sp.]